MSNDTTPNKTARATSADIARLKVGEKWGAYWKHADGWMRLYPPGGSAAGPQMISAEREPDPEPEPEFHQDDAEEDARNWADDL